MFGFNFDQTPFRRPLLHDCIDFTGGTRGAVLGLAHLPTSRDGGEDIPTSPTHSITPSKVVHEFQTVVIEILIYIED